MAELVQSEGVKISNYLVCDIRRAGKMLVPGFNAFTCGVVDLHLVRPLRHGNADLSQPSHVLVCCMWLYERA